MQRLERGKEREVWDESEIVLLAPSTYLYCTYKVGSFPVSPSPGKEGGRIEEKGRGGGKSDCVELDKSKKFLDGKKNFSPPLLCPPRLLAKKK